MPISSVEIMKIIDEREMHKKKTKEKQTKTYIYIYIYNL